MDLLRVFDECRGYIVITVPSAGGLSEHDEHSIETQTVSDSPESSISES